MNFADKVSCAVPTDWIAHPSQCLFEWQSLIAGVAATVAGGLVLAQIRQSANHRRDDIQRRRSAARLTLPLALAEVSQLVDIMLDEAAGVIETFGPNGFDHTIDAILDGRVERRRFEAISVPENVLTAFEGFVETLDDLADIKHVAELVALIQIVTSRYNGQNLQSPAVRINLQSMLIELAKIRLLVDKMYNYARRVDESSFGIVGRLPAEEAWDEVLGSAQGLVFTRPAPDVFFPDFEARIARYKESGRSPWLEKFR